MAPRNTTRAVSTLVSLGFCSLALAACGHSGSGKHHTNENVGGSAGSIGAAGTGAQVIGEAGAGGQVGAGLVGDAGAPSGDSGAAGAADKVPLAEIGNDVFDETELKSYYLTFSDEEYEKLTDLSTLLLDPYTVNEDRYVEASLRVGDTELPSIAVRYKGNYSIWGCVDYVTKKRVVRVEPFYGNVDVCERFSLKLDFDRFDSEARLDGLKKLNLHAMEADPSKMRERLGYSLFREMDIEAPRAVHARLYINGEYQGVFAVVENVDGRFTANRFGESGDGNLYRDLWPSAGTTSSDAEGALKTNEDPDVMDVSDFMAFNDAVAASTEADFAARMEPYLDLDYLARYIVVDRGITSFDGIMSFYFGTGWGPNNQNYFWYDVGGGRFTLIPWDLDKALWYPEPYYWSDNTPHDNGPLPNWNVTTKDCDGEMTDFDSAVTSDGVTYEGTYGVREIDCDPFLKLLRAQIYGLQKAVADAFIAGPFSESSVEAKLETWKAQIAEAMKDDPLTDSAAWKEAVDALLAEVPKLQDNLSLMMSGLIDETDVTGPPDTHEGEGTVTLEITEIDADYEGKFIAAVLIPGEADCATYDTSATYSGAAPISNGQGTVVISFVEAGTYTVCSLIDADDSGGPSSGDLTGTLTITVAGDLDQTWSTAEWVGVT
jgi:hypothetical protein